MNVKSTGSELGHQLIQEAFRLRPTLVVRKRRRPLKLEDVSWNRADMAYAAIMSKHDDMTGAGYVISLSERRSYEGGMKQSMWELSREFNGDESSFRLMSRNV